MGIRIEHVSKQFGSTVALRDITLEVQAQELFFLLGPSGCGKTTLLRLLAGFYQPDEGNIWFGHKPMAGIPPHQRNTGMVFQNYALWPHMSVADNVAYGLEVRKIPASERRVRVAEALAIVRMEAYAERMPNQLSGGQQQRVALARALVIKPDVLLLDEPLSNLDAKLRLEMREEIRRIHSETRITTVYVTHDQKEALSLADRIAVLHEGRSEQLGTPREIYRSPTSRFVADFIGETNWFSGRVTGGSASELRLETELGELRAPPKAGCQPGMAVQIGIRPEAVKIGSGKANTFATRIRHVSYLGDTEQYILEVGGGRQVKAFEQNPLLVREAGNLLTVHVRPEDVLVVLEK